jgi:hypothetical protein
VYFFNSKREGYLSEESKINDYTEFPGMTEIFKGIEFVRISALPQDQKDKIWKSFRQDKIIKIVKDEAVLVDCILYQDYISWLDQADSEVRPAQTQTIKTTHSSPIQGIFSKLALK